MNENLKEISENTSEEENLEKAGISAEEEGNKATTIQDKIEQFKIQELLPFSLRE